MGRGRELAVDMVDENMSVQTLVRDEIASGITGIVERDSFLMRIARRATDIAGLPGVALYTRVAPSSDLVLRASTFPSLERLPMRLPADLAAARDELSGVRLSDALLWDAHVAPIRDGGLAGMLVARTMRDQPLTDAQRETLDETAREIAPAVGVAELHHAVKQASVIDLSTGAYTQQYLSQRLDEEIARAQRTGSPTTLVLVRVLNFERVQYALGYDRADELLRALASEYAGLTRVFDVVGMRSRSDYSILLPDTDITSAGTVIARIHQRSARVIERFAGAAPGVAIEVVTGAASAPIDGDRMPEISLAAEQRLEQNVTLRLRMAESS